MRRPRAARRQVQRSASAWFRFPPEVITVGVRDVLLSEQRDTAAARRFFTRALTYGPAPVEVTTGKAGPYLRVADQLAPTAVHVTEQYGNNRIEADHGRLKARLGRMAD